jgi:hypothetical protein
MYSRHLPEQLAPRIKVFKEGGVVKKILHGHIFLNLNI